MKRKRRRREEEKPSQKRYGTMTISMDSSKIWYGSLVLYGYYLASNLGFVKISSLTKYVLKLGLVKL